MAPDITLTQVEADTLIATEKHAVDNQIWEFPTLGGEIIVPLISADKREEFLLDVSRGNINLGKVKHQNRARKIVVLLRLDIGGPPHKNPDEKIIPCPHLHIYRENFGDKWAFPVPFVRFKDINDTSQTLKDFMEYCNITRPPQITMGLW